LIACNKQNLDEERKGLAKKLEDMRKTMGESQILKVSFYFPTHNIKL